MIVFGCVIALLLAAVPSSGNLPSITVGSNPAATTADSGGAPAVSGRSRARLANRQAPALYVPAHGGSWENHSALNAQAGSYHVWSTRPSHRFFGCITPKNACTSWLKYVRAMVLPPALFEEAHSPAYRYQTVSYPEHGLYFKDQYNSGANNLTTLRSILNNGDYSTGVADRPHDRRIGTAGVGGTGTGRYFKWALVRHPWDRLVSSYRSKYEGQCNYSTACMEAKFRVPAQNASFYTFHDFVRRLTETPSEHIDSHFRPMHLLCEFGRIRYDFVGDLKVQADLDYISDRMGFPTRFSNFSGVHQYTRGPNSTYWGGQTHAIQPCRARTVIMAEQLYAADAALLGYSFADAHDACEKYRQSHPPGNAESMTAAELSDLRRRNKQLLLKDSKLAARWQYMPDQG